MSTDKELRQTINVGDSVFINPEHDYSATVTVVSVNEKEQKFVGCLVSTDNRNGVVGDNKEYPFHDVEKINGRFVMRRLMHYNGWHPSIDRIVSIGTKAQLDDNSDQANTLWESLSFACQLAHRGHRALIQVHCKSIYASVIELHQMGEYSTLADVGKHCYNEAINVPEGLLKAEKFFDKEMIEYNKVYAALLNMDLTTLRTMLTPEAQEKLMGHLK